MGDMEQSNNKLIRGRFQYDGITAGRGQLMYWGENTELHLFTNSSQRSLWVPPMPSVIKEKMAMLDVSGKGERVPGVGKKQSAMVYYLHFTPQEVQQMESEHEELRNAEQRARCSDGLEFSKQVSRT